MLAFLLTIADESNKEKVLYIYNRYHDSMMRFAKTELYALGSLNIDVNAEDAVQSAFLKIVRYIDRIDLSLGEKAVKSYIFSIVYHEIHNLLQEEAHLHDMEEMIEVDFNVNDADFIERLDIKQRYERVVRAISSLDEKYSFTLFWVYCQDMSIRNIADMLGISENTVYTRLARGKRYLLKILESGGIGDEQ